MIACAIAATAAIFLAPELAGAQRYITAPKIADSLAAIAAERRATGGSAWNHIGAVVMDGTITEGNVPDQFTRVIDLRTGYSRTVQDRGGALNVSGFDGMHWTSSNGIVSVQDLPPLVEDARSFAFVDRAGWRLLGNTTGKSLITHVARRSDGRSVAITFLPDSSSEVEVTFDARTLLVTRVEIQTDEGPVVMTFADWRSVGPVKFAFQVVETDNTGERTVTQLAHVKLQARAGAGAFARPSAIPHGHFIAGVSPATVPFTTSGARQTHISIPARVSGLDAILIFDTGAANYYSPDAAKRFGLTVSGGLNLNGVGESSTTGGFAKVDRVQIGSAELIDESVVVGPVPWPNSGSPSVAAGFAGYEFLSEFRTTIDYPNRTLTFAPFQSPAVEGTKVPFFSDGHAIYVVAVVDGLRGWFRLDTGDGGAVTLFPEFAARHNLYQNLGTAPTLPGGGGIGGRTKIQPITLSRFSFAGMTFDSLSAGLSQDKAGAFASRSLAGNLGASVLRCFRMTLDYRARLLTFEPRPKVDGCGRI
jgi:hypothetical protein